MPENEQAQFVEILSVARARADLRAPLTLLLIALLALATGCTARVSHESTTAAQADSEPTKPPAVEKHRTAVEIDLFGQRRSEPEAQEMASEHPSAAEAEDEPGDVILIVVKEVHKHRH
jgi:hypothetical protein